MSVDLVNTKGELQGNRSSRDGHPRNFALDVM